MSIAMGKLTKNRKLALGKLEEGKSYSLKEGNTQEKNKITTRRKKQRKKEQKEKNNNQKINVIIQPRENIQR